jgi:hypothetical protein
MKQFAASGDADLRRRPHLIAGHGTLANLEPVLGLSGCPAVLVEFAANVVTNLERLRTSRATPREMHKPRGGRKRRPDPEDVTAPIAGHALAGGFWIGTEKVVEIVHWLWLLR